MVLLKTRRANAALAERSLLTPRERQMLILVNGQRTIDDMAELFGPGAYAMAEDFLLKGYVMRASPMLRKVAQFSDTGSVHFALTQPHTLLSADEAPASRQAHAPKPAALPPRRSLAASKMYVIGLVQMMRDPEAASLAVSLHTSDSLEELTHWIVGALMFMLTHSGASYTERVFRRLLEIYPEAGLPALRDGVMLMEEPVLSALVLEQTAS